MTSISNDILGRVGNTHGGLSATLWSVLPLQQGIRTTPTLPTARRRLEGESSSYLVDEDGNEYEPYSLAWRYLGLFLDCQDKDSSNQQDGRKLNNEDNENQDTSQCLRKVLWAAYHDPNYSGGSIGEYQIFDLQTQSYADFNCHAERCVKMDCHESISQNFELVGVFKETDGLEVFTEQLFKHQGYCLWNENQYEFMQTYQSYIPTYCQQLYYADDDSRNNLWIHVEPQPYGKAGIGVYTDDACSTKSQTTSLEEYIRMFYEQEEGGDNDNDNKNNNNANGRQVAKAWIQALKKWNEMMNIYKTCRPCRAYNLHIGGNGDYNNNDANQGRQRQRQLNEDGEGDEEQWGYDCYDDAGYLNCNQCYKFETQTDYEPVTEHDLEQASKQGTILEITLNGKRYGKNPHHVQWPKWATVSLSLLAGLMFLAMATFICRKFGTSALFGTVLHWLRDKLFRKKTAIFVQRAFSY